MSSLVHNHFAVVIEYLAHINTRLLNHNPSKQATQCLQLEQKIRACAYVQPFQRIGQHGGLSVMM